MFRLLNRGLNTAIYKTTPVSIVKPELKKPKTAIDHITSDSVLTNGSIKYFRGYHR